MKHILYLKTFKYYLLGFILILNMGLLVHAQEKIPPYKIASIKAFLYHEQDGTFSENVFDFPRGSLWNTIIGEGASGGPSSSTMVVVEIEGQPKAYDTSRKLEFIAKEDNRIKLKMVTEISLLSESGKYYIVFWLYDTGMSFINLSARIIGQTSISKMEKTLEFTYGE